MLAYFVQFFMAVRPPVYVYVAGIVVLALLYGFRKPSATALTLLGGGGVLWGLEVSDAPFALADDGGFYENSTLSSWWSDRGSTGVIRESTPAAPITAGGSVIGGTIGEAAGDSEPESDEDLADRLDREIFGEPRPEAVPPPGGPRTIDLPLGENPDGDVR